MPASAAESLSMGARSWTLSWERLVGGRFQPDLAVIAHGPLNSHRPKQTVRPATIRSPFSAWCALTKEGDLCRHQICGSPSYAGRLGQR